MDGDIFGDMAVAHCQSYALKLIRQVRPHINILINCSFVRSSSKRIAEKSHIASLPGKGERKSELKVIVKFKGLRFLEQVPYIRHHDDSNVCRLPLVVMSWNDQNAGGRKLDDDVEW